MPVFHNKFPVADAVSVVELPSQKAVFPEIAGAAGSGFAVTVSAVEVEEQPLASVTITDFTALVVTERDCVVSPVFHNHELPLLAERVTVSPAQKVVGPLVLIFATGNVLTVTDSMEEVALHPFASVTTTYLFAVLSIVTERLVSPVFHNHAFPLLAVSITDPPSQKVVEPPVVMIADGSAFTVID